MCMMVSVDANGHQCMCIGRSMQCVPDSSTIFTNVMVLMTYLHSGHQCMHIGRSMQCVPDSSTIFTNVMVLMTYLHSGHQCMYIGWCKWSMQCAYLH